MACGLNVGSCGNHNSLEQQQEVVKIYPKRLLAIDFDQTLLKQNSDTEIQHLLLSEISTDIKNLHNNLGWTSYMQGIFELLHKDNVKEEQIRKFIRELSEVPGMIKLLKKLHKMNFDLILISDANTVFINEWCCAHGLDVFSKIYTNPAKFHDDLLTVEPFCHQTECDLCTVNICKGSILENFIKEKRDSENIKYANVIYIGDGNNDLCPILRLSGNDYGCVRKNFSLDKILSRNKDLVKGLKVKQLIKWFNGHDLSGELLKIFEQ